MITNDLVLPAVLNRSASWNPHRRGATSTAGGPGSGPDAIMIADVDPRIAHQRLEGVGWQACPSGRWGGAARGLGEPRGDGPGGRLSSGAGTAQEGG